MSTTRPVRSRRRFPAFDGLRAVGALFVVTTHVGFHSGASLNTEFRGLLSRMDSGVAIFFVLSGFLLFRPHVVAWLEGAPGPRLMTYLRHRALRILPALWLAVLGSALLLEQRDVPLAAYLRTATLTQIYTGGNEAQGLTQMWSLATEGAFYVLLPLAAYVVTRGRPTPRAVGARLLVLLATPLAGAAWMAFSSTAGHPLMAVWLPGFVGWFGVGMALALWQAAREAGLLRGGRLDLLAGSPSTAWALAATLFLVLASPVAGPYSLAPPTPFEAGSKSLLYAVFALLVVLPATATAESVPPLVRPLGGRVARWLGDVSYGVFCYHLIVLGLLEQAMDYRIFSGGFLRLWVPTVVLTLVVAAASHYLLERPVMRRGRRTRRIRVSPQATVATATNASA
ncbi:acyltransferase [Phycicoccus sp.]|uniref:acyltransferase family protein n=1 Tax=Phycicoccus sp. TaxID=1902410 RepID=UPI002C972114|nr:acyltransferase [Phycicoccus sp.]HMM94506.1 acyltransferase [Phycicoccus sp.]